MAQTQIVRTPTPLRLDRANSMGSSSSLQSRRGIPHSALRRIGFLGRQNEMGWAHRPRAMDRRHTGEPRPSWFANKADQKMPKPENMRELPAVKYGAVRQERQPGRGRTS